MGGAAGVHRTLANDVRAEPILVILASLLGAMALTPRGGARAADAGEAAPAKLVKPRLERVLNAIRPDSTIIEGASRIIVRAGPLQRREER